LKYGKLREEKEGIIVMSSFMAIKKRKQAGMHML